MASDKPPALPISFYRTLAGAEPVREWLRGLPDEDRRKLGVDLHRVQVGWPTGMPLCRSLGRGLWEMRSSLPSNRIARVLFFIHDDKIGVVHGFIKKTQKTPESDMALARTRMQEMQK